jgi:hypothetical protein
MSADDVAALGKRVWAWKDLGAFRSADDIPRIAHDPLWLPVFDAEAIAWKLGELNGLRSEWTALDVSNEPVSVQVDYRLIGSALARAWWDMDVMRAWERDAHFLVGQALGPYFDLLLPRAPFEPGRQDGLVNALEAVPRQLAVARVNLTRAGVADLATVALGALEGIGERLAESVAALHDFVAPSVHRRLVEASIPAARALTQFAEWLVEAGPRFGSPFVVGRERFVWYLRHVALIAAEPEAIVASAEQEYRRAAVWEAIGKNRRPEVPPFFDTVAQQVAQQRVDEREIREFYELGDLLTQQGFNHYEVDPVPAYVKPLQWFAVNDDLTDARRPNTPGVAYTPDPGPDLPYFYAANARDPRLGIIHEGAHYQQLVRAWSHENPLRRHFYDSVANEGIAHYNEEIMLQAGLFEGSQHSQNIIHNFTRLRALRVIVDVNLATGAYSLADGVKAFVTMVPMDEETATEETAMYVAAPGLAMSYLVGKLQLMSMLTTALEAAPAGREFSLRDFHDWVWKNGNLPFALQRWELLGDRSEVDILDRSGVTW